MTAVTSPARRTAVAGGGPTTGTAALVGLLLRRDRIKLPAWTLGITLFVPYFYGVVSTIVAPQSDPRASVDLLTSPMIRLFTGPVFGLEEFTLERYFVAAYFQEFLLAAALMNILLVARGGTAAHTMIKSTSWVPQGPRQTHHVDMITQRPGSRDEAAQAANARRASPFVSRSSAARPPLVSDLRITSR